MSLFASSKASRLSAHTPPQGYIKAWVEQHRNDIFALLTFVVIIVGNIVASDTYAMHPMSDKLQTIQQYR